MTQAHDTASTVGAEGGDVYVDGPDGVSYSMTPDAAADTSDRLLAGAAKAQGQRVAATKDEADRIARHPEQLSS